MKWCRYSIKVADERARKPANKAIIVKRAEISLQIVISVAYFIFANLPWPGAICGSGAALSNPSLLTELFYHESRPKANKRMPRDVIWAWHLNTFTSLYENVPEKSLFRANSCTDLRSFPAQLPRRTSNPNFKRKLDVFLTNCGSTTWHQFFSRSLISNGKKMLLEGKPRPIINRKYLARLGKVF